MFLAPEVAGRSCLNILNDVWNHVENSQRNHVDGRNLPDCLEPQQGKYHTWQVTGHDNLQPKSHTASHPWLLYDHSKCSALHTLDVRRRLHHHKRFQTNLAGDVTQQKGYIPCARKFSGLSYAPFNQMRPYQFAHTHCRSSIKTVIHAHNVL